MSDGEAPTLGRLRKWLMSILVLGVIGTGVELVLLEHTDGARQLVPLTLLGVSLVVLVWHAAARHVSSLRALQVTMALFVASGLVGIMFHYQGNVEFEVERLPSISGLELFREAMMGATPALAPGTMIQLGLIGLVYTYRHPLTDRRVDINSA